MRFSHCTSYAVGSRHLPAARALLFWPFSGVRAQTRRSSRRACDMTPALYVLDFAEIGLADVATVGGKNASLGEMFRALKPKRVGVLDGFATTAAAYRHLLSAQGLEGRLRTIFSPFDPENLVELARRGEAARAAVLETQIPQVVRVAICRRIRPPVRARGTPTRTGGTVIRHGGRPAGGVLRRRGRNLPECARP